MRQNNSLRAVGYKKLTFRKKLAVDFRKNKVVYPVAILVVAYFIIFNYVPLYGLTIAFQDYSPYKGFFGSTWVGFKHFQNFFANHMFFITVRNTFVISLSSLIFSFPMPIIFALLLNEIASNKFRRTVQTISYIPYFISIVVVCGMITDFFMPTGIVNQVFAYMGIGPINFLGEENMFVPLFVGSDIWQGIGYSSIIYLAAICGVDEELFDALRIDGGGRWRRVWNVILPSILPTIMILFILRCGMIMTVNFEKVLLLQNSLNMDVSEVITTLTYTQGVVKGKYSYSTAIELFNAIINLVFLLGANTISKKINGTSLW